MIVLPKNKTALLSIFTYLLLIVYLPSLGQGAFSYQKNSEGVVIQLKPASPDQPRLIKIQPISDKIIRIQASPTDSFPVKSSLMVLPSARNFSDWSIKDENENLLVQTQTLDVSISKSSGAISYRDKNGRAILEEAPYGKHMKAVVADGQPLLKLEQAFLSGDNEAYYGLGQHQSDLMDYKNRQVELLQNNTEVAVPFVVSSNNYGILWDNYSITKAGDVRDRLPLSSLKLFSSDGHEGWLSATYSNKNLESQVYIKRPESVIEYSFLESMKLFPDSFPAGNGKVIWDGAFESGFTGLHQFFIKYAGYIKFWVDGKLLVDRWRQPWNPGSAVVDLDLIKNKKYQLKIEWIPDGSQSYLAIDWLNPQSSSLANQFAFSSEAGTGIDYYFVYGGNLDEVISGYRQLTGKATLVPKWAMGLWQSRERYKTQEEILTTVKTFREKKIPLDNIVLDWSYWKQDEWGSQDFDLARFPDVEGMIKTLHDKYKVNLMISVWPKFYEGIQTYSDFNNKNWLYKRSIQDKQRDWIAKGYVSTFYDAFNPEAREGFWNLINSKLYKKGIDAWWLDASEPDILSNTNIQHRKELMSPTSIGSSTEYFNAYALQNAKGIYEGQRRENPGSRVFILTRSAFGGLQRYAAATWSGDIASRWEDMKAQISAGINFSMSGLPYWTMDIGGFAVEHRYTNAKGKDVDEWRELMTRWYQFGAFCPLYRVHGQFPFREIYNVAPENHAAYESMLYYDKLRYRLMPYIYSLAARSYHNDYTIMRGLVMDFPKDAQVKKISDQFMFGPSFLVNPVYKFEARQRQLYLPEGGWYNFDNGLYVQGGQHITADASMERMPLFVKQGSIIPFGPEIQYTSEKAANPVTILVYTGENASFDLYEDEGTNYNYEKGQFSKIHFQYDENSKKFTIGKREGNFPGMLSNRVFKIIKVAKSKPVPFDLNAKPDQSVQYKGQSVTVNLN